MDNTLSLLIVDDEPAIRNGLANAIEWEEYGIKVIGAASDGYEALHMVHQFNPHIIITDIRMPNCDGLELIRHIKEEEISSKFIIISGYNDFKYAQTAIKYQVFSYLLKPIQIEELIKEVINLRDATLTEIQNSQNLMNTRQQLQKQNQALKDHFCIRLLDNEYKNEAEIDEQLKNLKLSIQNTFNRVLVFSYDSIPVQDSLGFQKYIRQTVEDSFNGYSCAVFFRDAGTLAVIINTSGNKTSEMEIFKKICSNIIESLKRDTDINISIGIGDAAPNLLNTQASFFCALEALSYRLYQTRQRIFDSSIISREPTPVITPDTKTNQELADAIFRSDLPAIDRLLHQFFHSLFYVEIPPPNYIRGMCIFLVIDVQNGLLGYYDEINRLYTDVPYEEINRLQSFREIREWITNKFNTYSQYMNQNCLDKKDPIIQKAKAYIKENLYNKIKAENVAVHVGLSENYFTFYFKKKTNNNFKSYIQTLKIEKAKEHLKTSNILISELSSMLGYDDYRTFNRAFKKETGLTPSEYQQKYH
ncbi:two-component system, response regulator YesN [Anaerocolumna jejuensis DSM 15929]|uniref:Stage 0 sporulation protein A homolog n=1 Tax=Anaerocolumna jejuensis DSM 15929 TaxID=1121322 RepID=A0A1M6TAP7_9FIRM|nr:response regulator [Anaerocolumna jejuensis]SHK54065.1 two-component system, response regulator YesN [Anaerocolumna jejuensis DSM 15929]